MKKLIRIILFSIFFIGFYFIIFGTKSQIIYSIRKGIVSMNQLKDWENQYVTQRNRYPMHTPYGAYESVEQALSNNRNASAFVMSLNGLWKFRMYPSPEEAEPFWQTGFDCSDWQSSPSRWNPLPAALI